MGKRKRRRYGYLLLAICLIMLTACNANSKSQVSSDKKASEVLDVKNLKLKSDDGYGSLRFITPFVENKNYVFYIEDGGAGVYEINLNTLKKQRILGIKWYKDYSMDHPSYMEMTAYNGKLYYTRWSRRCYCRFNKNHCIRNCYVRFRS